MRLFDSLAYTTAQRREADRFVRQYARTLLSLGIDLTGKRVLSVGCGIGFCESALAMRGVCVQGVDYSPSMVTAARRCGHNVTQGDAYDTGCISGSFDYVICNLVLHHLTDVRAALLEVKRVLKRGGRVVVYEHNYRNPLCWISALLISLSVKLPRFFWLALHDREHFLGNRKIMHQLQTLGFIDVTETPLHHQESKRGIKNRLYALNSCVWQWLRHPRRGSLGVVITATHKRRDEEQVQA
jgi:ubiquinone/menaquinone biosynthesis C-methylase UbiE